MFEIEKMEKEFDYSLVDNETADFLRSCEYEMNGIAEDARVKLGGVLRKAQEKLAKGGYGVFLDWVKSGGVSKDDAYYYIELNRLSTNLERRQADNFLSAPKSLQKEVMKKKAPVEAKQAVLEGEVKTLKEYKELVKRLEETEQAKQQAEQQAKKLEQELQAERDKEPKVIEKTVEKVIDRTDYKKIEQLNNEINTLKQSLNRAVSQQDYEKLKRELEKKDDELLALTQSQLKAKDQQLIYSNASYLARDVGKWVNKLRMDIHERADIEGDKEVQRTLDACIKTLEEAIKEMQEWANIKTERGVVDAEYTVIT